MLLACLVSQKVYKMIRNDSTTSFLRVAPEGDSRFFELIQNLWNGKSITINFENAAQISIFAQELEIHELLSLLYKPGSPSIEPEERSTSTVAGIIQLKKNMHLDYSNEIKFAAMNFADFTIDQLREFTVEDLDLILTNENLSLESENDLFDVIMQLADLDKKYTCLLEHVTLELLDESSAISQFVNLVFPENVNQRIWEKISCFMTSRAAIQSSAEPGKKVSQNSKYTAKYTSSYPMRGIITRLTEEFGNPVTSGKIKITASTQSHNCHKVIEYGSGNVWFTSNAKNQWLQFDFNYKKIILTGYSIKSSHLQSPDHLQKWTIQGSLNGTRWFSLHDQDTTKLHTGLAYFPVPDNKQEFRYIRLLMKGKSSRGNEILELSEIDFFGSLV